MKIKNRINIFLYNRLLIVLNLHQTMTRKIIGKKFLGREIVFDFERTFESIFPKDKKIKFIQIGGNDGISFDNLYPKVIKRKSGGIILEPSPKYFEKLKANYEKFKSIHLLQKAIFEKRGKLELFELNEKGLKNHPSWAAGIGSIDLNNLLNLNVKLEEIDKVEVEGITFTDLLDSYPDFSDIDYLQIDTEGYDFQILKTIDFHVFKVKVIKFEFEVLPIDDQERAISMFESNFFMFRDELDLVCIRKGLKISCKL